MTIYLTMSKSITFTGSAPDLTLNPECVCQPAVSKSVFTSVYKTVGLCGLSVAEFARKSESVYCVCGFSFDLSVYLTLIKSFVIT